MRSPVESFETELLDLTAADWSALVEHDDPLLADGVARVCQAVLDGIDASPDGPPAT